ncbi:cupin domain-containing protein [Bartonella sp. HY329]|uniref:(R)-mandelonitrile lyase n=1 Tax=unclassified Bartonella TaxID=2645622 RepID=UPI0021C96595|nr:MULTISPECIES: cupin domain-containing protein [unclassified Bartonella]UXM96284.1 cupin domain-containing protein [Bartonella sp. HY329]UXN10608.1 cupin domain-containing protein [Bartonella sp. HY328]
MEIIRSGSRSSVKLSPDYFTGTARLDAVIDEHQGANVTCGHVTFEPSARTNWHTHPKGQAIIITFGLGLVQKEGGPIEEVRPGDVVWFEPGERHWHGASPNTAMSHFAVQELENGKTVEWLEPVSDAQYSR